ncbi:unnamed protein product [Caenorhabditis brenneri]
MNILSEHEIKLTIKEVEQLENDTAILPIFKSFYKCIKPKLLPFKGNYKKFWYKFTEVTSRCENLNEYKQLDIRSMQNKDETKYVAFPHKNENLTMVTLGIGHDVVAELQLRDLYSNIEFFGADPSIEQNKELFENSLGGKYFQYAVSDKNKTDESFILEKEDYKKRVTQHISINSFLKNILHRKKIDILWIDIEGNEYSILPQLYKNSQLEKDGIKICQMNIEFHKAISSEPDAELRLFYEFVWKVLEDKKYILMKPVFLDYLPFPNIRLFILNVFDKECTDLYLK